MKLVPCVIAVLLASAPALAGDAPHYSMLVDMPKRIDALHKDLDQLEVSVRIKSTDPTVQSSDITVEARLKSGKVVRIPIAKNGTFTAPLSQELAEEDPLLVTNQPNGTLVLAVQINIKPPAVAAQPYADLMRGLSHVDMAKKRVGIFQGMKPHGLLFAFDEGEHTLTVNTKKMGSKVFSSVSLEQARKYVKEAPLPDDVISTYIYVPMDQDLMAENPQTFFDTLPVRVHPAL